MTGIDPGAVIEVFERAIARAREAGARHPESAALATVDAQGRPSVRMVIAHPGGVDGFVFYTNLGSQKATELTGNPRAALCYHWVEIHEQIRIEGEARPVAPAIADAYWASRPEGSQVAAWASRQSAPVDRRETLEARVGTYRARFDGDAVPRPDFWSGFALIPDRLEHWRGDADRLHERTDFRLTGRGWVRSILQP